MRARGATSNPTGRFEPLRLTPSAQEAFEQEGRELSTVLLEDTSRSIVTTNQSPDVGFDASLNPYRGCEHGCIYCYARPTHETLGFSAGLDFESKILVKPRAPELLRERLEKPSWKPQVIAMSGVTDPYQPTERFLRITRGCLAVLAEFRNPVGIVTKSRLVSRDIDVLQELARFQCAKVLVSITTLDPELQSRLEPRASRPNGRLRAVEELAKAGVPVGVMVAPIIPGLTDHETPRILQAAADAGAESAGRVVLKLPYGVKDLFTDWLEKHFPERKDKVLNRLRDLRGGKLYDARFGVRQRGTGLYADHIENVFLLWRRKVGLHRRGPGLSTKHFRVPPRSGDQQSLFDVS